MVVMTDAGTRIAPMPKPATTRIGYMTTKVSESCVLGGCSPFILYGVDNAINATPETKLAHPSLNTKNFLPIVIVIVELSMSDLIWPRVTVSATRTMQQPTMIAKPIGRPLNPTPTGFWSYVLNVCVGQNMSTNKEVSKAWNGSGIGIDLRRNLRLTRLLSPTSGLRFSDLVLC